jgi:hypothetical protein
MYVDQYSHAMSTEVFGFSTSALCSAATDLWSSHACSQSPLGQPSTFMLATKINTGTSLHASITHVSQGSSATRRNTKVKSSRLVAEVSRIKSKALRHSSEWLNLGKWSSQWRGKRNFQAATFHVNIPKKQESLIHCGLKRINTPRQILPARLLRANPWWAATRVSVKIWTTEEQRTIPAAQIQARSALPLVQASACDEFQPTVTVLGIFGTEDTGTRQYWRQCITVCSRTSHVLRTWGRGWMKPAPKDTIRNYSI